MLKKVYIEDKLKNKYESNLGIIYTIPDSICLMTELARAGLAWYYKNYNKNEAWVT
jgi:hypothetical protein